MKKAPLTYRYATIGRRMSAGGIDIFLIILICVACNALLGLPLYFLEVDKTSIITMLICIDIVLATIYFPSFECSSSMATPGKAALGLVVAQQSDRSRITIKSSIKRTALKILSAISVFGLLMAVKSPRKQTWHDVHAGSMVLTRK